MSERQRPIELTPELLLRAYSAGVFPMANSADTDEIFWVDPRVRGILPLNDFHMSKSLAKTLRRQAFRVTIDTDFLGVIDGCAAREETWINPTIRALYLGLHTVGHAHSLEVWMPGENGSEILAGGLYGVRLGAAFFGESMFSFKPDASKIALAYLVARLLKGRFRLLDTQFVTDHLASLGAHTVPRSKYHELLDQAVSREADFFALPIDTSGTGIAELITERSLRT